MRRNTICPRYVLWQWCLWKLPHQQTFDTFDTFIIATQHSVSGNCFSTALQLSSSGKGVYRHQRIQAPETITTHTKRKHVNVRLCTGNRDMYSWVSHHIKWPNRQKVQRLMMSREIGCVNPLAIWSWEADTFFSHHTKCFGLQRKNVALPSNVSHTSDGWSTN